MEGGRQRLLPTADGEVDDLVNSVKLFLREPLGVFLMTEYGKKGIACQIE